MRAHIGAGGAGFDGAGYTDKSKTPRLSPGRLREICVYADEGASGLVALLVAATVAAAIATATAAAATTTAEGTARSAAATAAAAFFTRTGFVDGQRATLHGLAVEEADGFLGFFSRGHGHEGEAAAFAGELILHESDFGDGAGFGESVLKVDFGGIEGKISYVELIGHTAVFVFTSGTFGGCFRLSDLKTATESPRTSRVTKQLAIYQTY